MAKEYIERNELIENLNRFASEHYNALINQLITKQPTADVVEMKYGEWLEVDSDVGWELVRCSLCGKEQSLFQDGEKTLYCPECGAKMSVNYESSKNESE